MIFERTRDYNLVKRIVTHPQVWRRSIIADGTPPRDEYLPNTDPDVVYVVAKEGGRLLGLFMFVPQTETRWQVHFAMLPDGWGLPALDAGQGLVAWLRRNTPCLEVFAKIPAYNTLAIAFARRSGIREVGVEREAISKDGQHHDLLLFEEKVGT